MIKRFVTEYHDLPDDLPIFPLPRVLLLPRGDLPLNIFEERYLNMVDDVLKTHRLIGVIQPRADSHNDNADPAAIYSVGCAGRISAFQETEDGRYLVTLTGVCRFDVVKELPRCNGYRRVVPDWRAYKGDFIPEDSVDAGRDKLLPVLRTYLEQRDMICEKWDEIPAIRDEKLVTCLSMICPFDTVEKQALLEAPDLTARAATLYGLLEMAIGINEKEASRH